MTKILVVEDDTAMSLLMERVLRSGGYDVVTCSDVRMAEEAIDHHEFDLVTLDMKLEGAESGLDFLRLLRHRDRDMPVVVITGYSLPGSQSALHRAVDQFRVSRFLVKPIDIFALLDEVRAVLAEATVESDGDEDA